MDRTSYTNLAKAWEFVEDHAFSRQSVELNAVRTRAEETGIAQGSAAQAELLRVLVHMIRKHRFILKDIPTEERFILLCMERNIVLQTEK